MTPLQILKKARALIKKGWCQRAFARTARGKALANWSSPHAARFCMRGAIRRIGDYQDPAAGAMRAIGQVVGTIEISSWNDESGRTQAQVLAAFDHAIKAESKR